MKQRIVEHRRRAVEIGKARRAPISDNAVLDDDDLSRKTFSRRRIKDRFEFSRQQSVFASGRAGPVGRTS